MFLGRDGDSRAPITVSFQALCVFGLGFPRVKGDRYICIVFVGVVESPLSKSLVKAHIVLTTGHVLLGCSSMAIVLFPRVME